MKSIVLVTQYDSVLFTGETYSVAIEEVKKLFKEENKNRLSKEDNYLSVTTDIYKGVTELTCSIKERGTKEVIYEETFDLTEIKLHEVGDMNGLEN